MITCFNNQCKISGSNLNLRYMAKVRSFILKCKSEIPTTYMYKVCKFTLNCERERKTYQVVTKVIIKSGQELHL